MTSILTKPNSDYAYRLVPDYEDPVVTIIFPNEEQCWQIKYLEDADEFCVDSTHKTCKSYHTPGQDCYLFTVVIRSSVTNKGLPVCFFITDFEIIPTISKWLKWLKGSFKLKVKRIMIDCSPTEIAAINEVFKNDVDTLLCHWHIKRAWESHIKKDFVVPNATEETRLLRDRVRASLNNMMYCLFQEIEKKLQIIEKSFSNY